MEKGRASGYYGHLPYSWVNVDFLRTQSIVDKQKNAAGFRL